MKKFSCIIPAYNEEKGIGNILSLVVPLIGECLYEVIVINDGSTDNTAQIIKQFPSVIFIDNKVNKGKSKSVCDGIINANGDYIFLLDADLKFLNKKNINDLIFPIENDISQVSISYIKNSWPLFPFKRINYLSGQRILPKSYLLNRIKDINLLSSYGLEVFINRIIIKNKLSIKVIQWPSVENNFSQNKRGWLKGIKNNIKVWWNILYTVSIFEMYYQNIILIRLIVK